MAKIKKSPPSGGDWFGLITSKVFVVTATSVTYHFFIEGVRKVWMVWCITLNDIAVEFCAVQFSSLKAGAGHIQATEICEHQLLVREVCSSECF